MYQNIRKSQQKKIRLVSEVMSPEPVSLEALDHTVGPLKGLRR